MSNDRVFSRREAIKFAVAAAVAALVQSQAPGAVALQGAQQALPTRLTALLAHSESAKVIGGEYLRNYPQEANLDLLLGQIASRMAANAVGLLTMNDQRLREGLDGLVRADFAADRIVKLRGWVLSATEARLCALAALM
jgi:hypothetical protein